MSVINRVLRDLDKAGEVPRSAPPAAPEATGTEHRRLVLLVGIALMGLALLVWLLLPAGHSPRPGGPVPGTAHGTASPAPAASAAAPPVRGHASPTPLPGFPAPTDGPAVPAASPTPEPAVMPAEPMAAPEPRTLPKPTPAPLHGAPAMVKEAAPPDPVEEAWREAGQWLAQGRSRDARDRLAQVLKLAPRHDAARQTLITLLIEAGERGEAQRLLAEGRDLHPQEPWYPRALAQLHLQNGRPAQAAASLQSALNASSRAEDWALYAGVAAKLGRHDEAASAWRSALRGQPDQGVWWIGLGVALERLGQRPDALQAYQRAALTQLSPELREFVQGKLAE